MTYNVFDGTLNVTQSINFQLITKTTELNELEYCTETFAELSLTLCLPDCLSFKD